MFKPDKNQKVTTYTFVVKFQALLTKAQQKSNLQEQQFQKISIPPPWKGFSLKEMPPTPLKMHLASYVPLKFLAFKDPHPLEFPIPSVVLWGKKISTPSPSTPTNKKEGHWKLQIQGTRSRNQRKISNSMIA